MRLGPGGWAIAVMSLLGLAGPALAHNPITSEGADRLAGIMTALLLAAFWLIYVRGARRRRPGPQLQWLFHIIAIIAVVTLLGPLDDLAKTRTSAHMTQHMLLMVVIAPLWVLARPLPALDAGGGRLFRPLWQPLLSLVRHPLSCAWLHAVAIWVWHMPRFYMAAVDNPWWHAVEHACFLLSAGLFWWAILRSSVEKTGFALLALLFTLMHTGFLGAILTFSSAPIYGEARDLQDQQLAGLIMWVLGAIPYLIASAWISHRWYRRIMRER